jgi:sortase (surface protein transpeptidase)
VIPSAGIIAPIREMPEGTDRKKIITGKEIQVNPYLREGVLHYPNSALPGELGNMIVSGHSSYWKSDKQGRYRTVFGNLPTVDV